MRRFVFAGGKKDGQQVNIKHGKSVFCADTGERYVVYSEPIEKASGVLVPDGLQEDEVEALVDKVFPWRRSKT